MLAEEEVADQFVQALGVLEREGDVEPLIALFAEDCSIETPIISQPLHGKIEARAFWTGYRATFRRIASTFRNRVAADGRVTMEWTARCVNRSGREFSYDGVTVLDLAGGGIGRFRSYFDSPVAQRGRVN